MSGPGVPVFAVIAETTDRAMVLVAEPDGCGGCGQELSAWIGYAAWTGWLHDPAGTPLDAYTRYVLRTGRHPQCPRTTWRAA